MHSERPLNQCRGCVLEEHQEHSHDRTRDSFLNNIDAYRMTSDLQTLRDIVRGCWNWTTARIGCLRTDETGKGHFHVIINRMLKTASGLVGVSLVRQDIKQNFRKTVAAFHFLAVLETLFSQSHTLVRNVLKIPS
jgi:hypothetical protein